MTVPEPVIVPSRCRICIVLALCLLSWMVVYGAYIVVGWVLKGLFG